jgi:elongation factor Ts
MANYTLQDIKDLRAATGAGMTDVKKALDEADGNLDKAVELIRKRGLAKAAKREGNVTGEGLVTIKVEDGAAGQIATMIELLAETDFVVKNEKFIALAEDILTAVAAAGAADTTAALAAPMNGETVNDVMTVAAGMMGEKIVLNRVARVEGPVVTTYLHRKAKDLPPAIGVVVVTTGATETAAKDVAQHVAAMRPSYLTRDAVPAEIVEKEREIAREITIAEGKPEAALPKIVEGRLNGFFKGEVLIEQPLAKDPSVTVAKHAENAGVEIVEFARFEVGN